MAQNQLGTKIREARTAKGLTQEKLAARLAGISAADVSKMERGETIPSQEVIRQIAKLTGVTQSSLLEAAKADREKNQGNTAAKKPASAAKKPAASAKKPASSSGTKETLTSAEKKFLEAYRKADADTRKAALKVLNGESTSLLDTILGGGKPGSFADIAQNMTESAVGNFLGDLLGNLGK